MPVTYPSVITAANAILEARSRTGQTAGQPTDATIQTFLNRALQNVERRVGAIYANASPAIAQGVNSLQLPADIQYLVNINFSTTLPSASNAVIYPIDLMQEGAFERFVGFMPTQSVGWPSKAFVQSDASGVLTLQFDGILQTAGFINCYYKQRPQTYTDTQSSVVQLDPMFEEGMIVWTCRAICENRAMWSAVKYWTGEFTRVIEEIKEDVQMRDVPQRAVVADVSMMVVGGAPGWADWD